MKIEHKRKISLGLLKHTPVLCSWPLCGNNTDFNATLP